MKTAISVPDELFEEAEKLARRLNRSRSRLFADAVREYIARHDPDAVTAALDRVYAEADGECDPFTSTAAAQILERTDW
jgi:metal-responsive CopG/Arc/MetJ family transcriptional regulator